jgi:hypothetical protein
MKKKLLAQLEAKKRQLETEAKSALKIEKPPTEKAESEK